MSATRASTSALAEFDQQPTAPATQKFVCSLCCDEKSVAGESVILAGCSHQGCRACIGKWIEKQESSGKADSPTCPFCRVNIQDYEVISILGRSFNQRKGPAGLGNDEIDELTLHWLNEQTTLCPGCGSRIEKTDGCDHMTCLCGYEFCYQCGETHCLCDDEGDEEGFTYTREEEPIRDANGIVNIRACICRRNGFFVRDERRRRRLARRDEEKSRWAYADFHDPAFRHSPCNGSWLFSCRKSSTSALMLAQLCNSHDIRKQRRETKLVNQQRREESRIDEENRWMYTYEQTHNRHLAAYNSCDGVWLYSCRKSSSSMRVLLQQRNSLSIRLGRQREEKRLSQSNPYIPPVCPSWLFENESQESQLLALHLLFCRNWKCVICNSSEAQQDSENLANIKLLFWDDSEE